MKKHKARHCASHCEDHPTRDHSAHSSRLNRVRGQVDAVARMLEEGRYCPEVIQQVRAATSALKALEKELMRGHLEGCVADAFSSKKPNLAQEKVEEILRLLS